MGTAPLTKAAIDPSISLARAAIQEAELRGFSIDADTFRVWFAYVSEEDPLVCDYIDRLDAKGADITRDDIDRLLHLLPTDPPKAAMAAMPHRAAEPAPEPKPEPDLLPIARKAAALYAKAAARSQPPRAVSKRRTAALDAPQVAVAEAPRPAPQPVAQPIAPEVDEDLPPFRSPTPFDKLSELPNRHAFSKDVRRRWLHPDAKKGPQTIFLTACRKAGQAKPAKGNEHLISPMQAVMLVALTRVFEKLGPVYRYDAQTIGLILSGVNLRQTVSIAEAVRRSIEAKRDIAETQGKGKVLFSSAAVSLMADEDPARALSLADRCLAVAMSFDDSRVVCETDPIMQPPGAKAAADAPIADQYAHIRQLLQAH